MDIPEKVHPQSQHIQLPSLENDALVELKIHTTNDKAEEHHRTMDGLGASPFLYEALG